MQHQFVCHFYFLMSLNSIPKYSLENCKAIMEAMGNIIFEINICTLFRRKINPCITINLKSTKQSKTSTTTISGHAWLPRHDFTNKSYLFFFKMKPLKQQL